jgi:hypothetical protein
MSNITTDQAKHGMHYATPGMYMSDNNEPKKEKKTLKMSMFE